MHSTDRQVRELAQRVARLERSQRLLQATIDAFSACPCLPTEPAKRPESQRSVYDDPEALAALQRAWDGIDG